MKNFDDDFNYTVVKNKREGTETFETYGEDWNKVLATDPNHVWTIVEDEKGRLIVIPGRHFVNRFMYIITKERIRGEDLHSEYLYHEGA